MGLSKLGCYQKIQIQPIEIKIPVLLSKRAQKVYCTVLLVTSSTYLPLVPSLPPRRLLHAIAYALFVARHGGRAVALERTPIPHNGLSVLRHTDVHTCISKQGCHESRRRICIHSFYYFLHSFPPAVSLHAGYGNIAPSTPGGQTFFVFYAIAGIPLALIVFSSVGTILSNGLGSLVGRIKTKRPLPLKVAVVVGAIITGLVLFIFVPAIIFMAIEGWTYRQSAYYCVVSLTTIGFGDFVPGQSTSTDLPVGVRGVYKVCTACWLLFGIAFLSLLIAEVQKLFTTSVAAIKSLCKKKKPEDTEEQDGKGKVGGEKSDGSSQCGVPLGD